MHLSRAALFAISLGFAAPSHAGIWSESWGSLVWGTAPVPLMSEWGLLLQGALLGITGSWLLARRKRAHASALLLAALVVAPMAFRAVTVPNTFSNGTTADADEVNANFDALAGAITTLEGGSDTLQLGRSAGCVSTGYRFVPLGSRMAAPPVFVTTIDESLDNLGAVWVRIQRRERSEVAVRCDIAAEALAWLAIVPGMHTLDGRLVQAGVASNVSSLSTVSFPQAFSAPPIVLLTPQESDNSGATVVRVIGNVTATDFQIFADATVGELHWVAMEPGTYNVGSASFEAGVANIGGCSICPFSFGSAFVESPGVVMTINDVNNSGPSQVRLQAVSPGGATARLNFAGGENLFYLAFLR